MAVRPDRSKVLPLASQMVNSPSTLIEPLLLIVIFAKLPSFRFTSQQPFDLNFRSYGFLLLPFENCLLPADECADFPELRVRRVRTEGFDHRQDQDYQEQ